MDVGAHTCNQVSKSFIYAPEMTGIQAKTHIMHEEVRSHGADDGQDALEAELWEKALAGVKHSKYLVPHNPLPAM